ncbi:MAG: SDR family oxidoreductase [Actinobacteria bacterium]|nr:SDR family oxidoreductase [Actinomycetota bacterium]
MRVLVIAGASGESGRAVARRFSDDGWKVIALGSNAERLEPVQADERVVIDLRDASSTTAVAKAIVERWGRVDGVVHLVGRWSPGHGDATLTNLLDANLVTLRNTSLAFWDALIESGDGRLVMVSSPVVDRPVWREANYAISKAAAETWMRSFSRSWGREAAAAAVIFRVKFLGEGKGGTPVSALADACAALWEKPVVELNGTTVNLATVPDTRERKVSPKPQPTSP